MPTILQWVKILEEKIEQQKWYAAPYEVRYANEYALPFIAAEYREVYGERADSLLHAQLEAPRVGAAAMGVDALVERLTVLGGTSDDRATARALEAAWEANDMDVMHREAHRESLVRRTAFGAVSRAVGDDSKAILTIESSEQCAGHRMSSPPYDLDAWLKISVDEWTGQRKALLQLPNRDIRLEERKESQPDPEGANITSRWYALDNGDTYRQGPVPVVEFPHGPRLLVEPKSEIEPIVTLVDEVDLIEGLMVFAGHFGAVPIRFGTGLEIPRDPKDPSKPLLGPDGKPMLGFKPRADHFWGNSSKDANFGQLTPATLDTFVTWSNHAKGNLRSKTKVASSYYALELKSHMSAELLKTDEAPMVRRINGMGRQGVYNQAWRRALTLMMMYEGQRGRVKPVWEDPQTRMEGPAVDAFQKAVASGLGVVTAAEKFLGWTRTEAEKAVAEHEEAVARMQTLQSDPIAAALLREAGLSVDSNQGA